MRHGQDAVAGLGRGHQVADRADAADAGAEPGHLPERPAHAEALETAKLGDVEARVGEPARRRRGRCVILACPSIRVTGSMRMRCVMVCLSTIPTRSAPER